MPQSTPLSLDTSPPSVGPRRAFVTRLAALVAAWPVLGRRLTGLGSPRSAITPPIALAPNAPLVATMLASVGDAVLPAELGTEGMARAVAAFQRWMDGYRPGAEANHGYGTGRIERLPADPRPQWTAQLTALEAEARRGGTAFAALPRDRRQAMLRVALAGERGESLPAPLAARHVALALLAHFYDSSAATDLCYGAEIGRQQCRPLGAQSQQPVALTRRDR